MRDSVHDSLIAFRIGIAFRVDLQDSRIRVDTEQVT